MAVYEQRYSSCNQVGPTSFQRLPPDGHEFPNTFTESLPDKLSRYNRYAKLDLNTSSHSGYSELSSQFSRSAPGTPTSPPPALPKSASPSSKANSIASNSSFDRDDETLEQRHSSSSSSTTDEARPKDSGSYRTSSSSFSSRWRRQDEKSGKSVRDKIAMFSTEQPYPKSRKIEDIQTPDKNGCGSLKRAFTEDDVRVGNSSKISLARSQTLKSNGSSASSSCLSKYNTFSSMIDVSASESKENVRPVSAASSAADICQSSLRESYSKCEPVREEMETHRITKTADDSRVSGLHSRSQSMIDIGKPSLTKRHSIGAYDRPSVYKYGIEKPEDRERRTSLNNLIEQRRKSISKLRGLVIPESKCQTEKSSFDLPRISSIPPTAALKTMSLPRDTKSSSKHDSVPNTVCNESSADEISSSPALSTPPWKTQHGPYSLTKYSPSSKHKSVTEYQDQESAFTPNTLPSPQTSLRRNVSAYSDCSYSSASSSLDLSLEYGDSRSANDNVCNPSTYQSYMIEARLGKTEDSDNDSAVSSAQSYLSQDTSPSPSVSPTPEKLYRGSRTPTQNSKKGLLSRIPSEDSDGHRVLKPGSIEAENRRNVLKSAKCSSGRNSDDQSGPDIIPKVPLTPNEKHEEVPFTEKLDSDLRKNKAHVPRQASADSTSSSSSRRSSQDSSRRNSRESVIHVPKTQDEAIKVSAEPVYFDQHGDMYKEAQLKVAYMNEISDEFDELCSDKVDNVVNEIPITVARHIRDEDSYENNKSYGDIGVSWKRKDTGLGNILEKTNSHGSDSSGELLGDIPTSPTKTNRPRGFKALAESWQQRAEEDASPLPTAAPRERRTSRSTSVYEEGESFITKDKYSSISSRTTVTTYESVGDTESRRIKETFAEEESQTSRSASNLDLPRHEGHDRKLSMPEYSSSGIKMRERHDGSIPSRPTSLIEGSKNLSALEGENHYLPPKPLSPTASSADSREDFLDSTDSGSLSRTASKEVLEAFSRARVSVVGNSRTGAVFTPKVSDIMRAFERHDFGNRRSGVGTGTSHPRMSSLDSTASEDGSALYGSVSSLTSGQRDQYGSITSLASSTSLISPQELAQLIDEANQSLEESGTPSHEILVVVLHREIVCQGSIGITLAGGADYETKEITVHKIIPGSLADRDGRIQRGDRILSINGKNLRGVTHKEALTILKSPRPEVVLVLSRSRSVTPQESGLSDGDAVLSHRTAFINHVTTPRPPKILESPMDSKSLVSDAAALAVPRGPPMVTTLVKDGAGLGFSLEGGKDSPLGDRPLTIKKIFSGGTADKSGVLRVGDELVSVNGVDVTAMARIEAWNFLKKLPDGTVTLIIRKLEEQSKTE